MRIKTRYLKTTAIFLTISTSQFLYSFLSSIRLSIWRSMKKAVHIPEQADNFNDIRIEYMGMLKNQLSRGNNGIIKRKFITFGIEADNLKAAKQKLERIETDILGNFKALGVQARPLNGLERLELLHCTFNEGEKKRQIRLSLGFGT